jgi:hypothetical protein
MDSSLYEPEAGILQRLEDRLKATLKLREVIAEVDLANLTAGNIAAPSLALIASPAVVKDADLHSVLIETRWTVVSVARSYNDSRADQARDEVGRMSLEVIRNLIGWSPAAGFGPLMLRQIPSRRFTQSRVFAPLVLGSATSIDAIP